MRLVRVDGQAFLTGLGILTAIAIAVAGLLATGSCAGERRAAAGRSVAVGGGGAGGGSGREIDLSDRTDRAERRLREAIERWPAGAKAAVAALRPTSGHAILLDAHRSLHAASTMKVPVLIELFRAFDLGRWTPADSVPLENAFRSIVDGSPYALDPADDSDSLPYRWIGSRVRLDRLAERMVTVSSNLATNVLVELVTADSVNATLARIGAGEMRVLRGVEDGLAFERGLNNTTTAYGFARALEAILWAEWGEPVTGVSREGARAMVGILSRQSFSDGIPAGLPPAVRVAHKTGSITRVEHDGGIVYPPAGDPYVLVVLTEGFEEGERAKRAIAELSRIVWEGWGTTEASAGRPR